MDIDVVKEIPLVQAQDWRILHILEGIVNKKMNAQVKKENSKVPN